MPILYFEIKFYIRKEIDNKRIKHVKLFMNELILWNFISQ